MDVSICDKLPSEDCKHVNVLTNESSFVVHSQRTNHQTTKHKALQISQSGLSDGEWMSENETTDSLLVVMLEC